MAEYTQEELREIGNKQEKYLELREQSQERSLSANEAIELNTLDEYLREIDNEKLQKSLDAADEAAAKARQEEDLKARVRKKSKKTIAHIASKLAFDKNKKPNLTTATACFMKKNMESFIFDSFRRNPKGWSSFVCAHDESNLKIPFGSALNGYMGDGDNKEPRIDFLNLESIYHTLLKPKVRIYKVIINSRNRIVDEIELSFPSDASEKLATEILSSNSSDAGIRRLTVDFKNQNPFAAGRMVDVNLEIFLNGATAFDVPRGFYSARKAGNGVSAELEPDYSKTFSIRDLVMRRNALDPEKYDGLHYGIRMVIGYERPQTKNSSVSFPDNLLQAIKENETSMMLQLVEYDLNIEQNGTIALSLQYKGRIESQFENKDKYDIFDFEGITRDSLSTTSRMVQNQEDLIEDLESKQREVEKDLKLLYSEKYWIHRNGSYEAGQALNAISPAAGVGMFVAPWYVGWAPTTYAAFLIGNVAADEFHGADQERYLKHRERMSQLDKSFEEKQKELAKITNDINAANNFKIQGEKKLGLLKQENKVLKYSRILDNLQKNNKIYRLVVDLDNLVLYGAEFEAQLQSRIELIEADTGMDPKERQLEIESLKYALDQAKNHESRTYRRQISKQTAQPGSNNFISVLREKIKKKSEEIAAKSTGDSLTTEQLYKQAASEVPLEEVLSPVGDSVPEKGKADSIEEFQNKKRIYWFYFGDLVDAVLKLNPDFEKSIEMQMERDHNTIILGPGYLDVGTESQAKTLVYNVADVPIPLDLYQDFFIKNVVERDIDQYNFFQFLKDAFYQLVSVLINQKCGGETNPMPVNVQVNTVQYSSRGGQTIPDMFVDKEIYRDTNFSSACPLRSIVTANNVLNISNGVHFKDSLDRVKTATFYSRFGITEEAVSELAKARHIANTSYSNHVWNYVAYSLEPTGFKRSMNGDIRQDSRSGVHHLFIGKDRGLVKSVNFRKNKKPGITTMMVERANERREENIELWAIFDIELTLVGNSLFKPGMHLYLHPTLPGFGDPKDQTSLSRTLGLGGYYLVTSVTNDLVPNWETKLTAKWVSYPVESEFQSEVVDPIHGDKSKIVDLQDGKIKTIGEIGDLGKNVRPVVLRTVEKPAKGRPKTTKELLQDFNNGVRLREDAPTIKQLMGQTGFMESVETRFVAIKEIDENFNFITAQRLGTTSSGSGEIENQVGKNLQQQINKIYAGESTGKVTLDKEMGSGRTVSFETESGKLVTAFFYGYTGNDLSTSQVVNVIQQVDVDRSGEE